VFILLISINDFALCQAWLALGLLKPAPRSNQLSIPGLENYVLAFLAWVQTGHVWVAGVILYQVMLSSLRWGTMKRCMHPLKLFSPINPVKVSHYQPF